MCLLYHKRITKILFSVSLFSGIFFFYSICLRVFLSFFGNTSVPLILLSCCTWIDLQMLILFHSKKKIPMKGGSKKAETETSFIKISVAFIHSLNDDLLFPWMNMILCFCYCIQYGFPIEKPQWESTIEKKRENTGQINPSMTLFTFWECSSFETNLLYTFLTILSSRRRREREKERQERSKQDFCPAFH